MQANMYYAEVMIFTPRHADSPLMYVKVAICAETIEHARELLVKDYSNQYRRAEISSIGKAVVGSSVEYDRREFRS